VVVHVPDLAQTSEGSEATPSCPKSSWEPPVVAASDLPTAAQSHAWQQRALASNDAATRAARPAPEVVRHAPPQPKAWSAATVRRGRFAGTAIPSAAKAKSAPKTLVEWMRASVDPG
jgi:hypothetical protein